MSNFVAVQPLQLGLLQYTQYGSFVFHCETLTPMVM
jgi:hypothetical protein